MESFYIAANAVFPLLVYIAFGYFVRRVGWFAESSMRILSKLIFHAFFPIMMFRNMYQMDIGDISNLNFVFFSIIILLILIGISFLIVPRLVSENEKRGVIIQGIYRTNIMLFAVALVDNIYGAEGTAFVTVLTGFVIPIYNVVAVLILEYYHGESTSFPSLIKSAVTNPLIVGIATGFIVHILGITIPEMIAKPIFKYGEIVTPLAMFALGGTLHFSAVKTNAKYLIPVLSAKLVIIPLIVFVIATWFGFGHIERFVILTMFATPSSTTSYTMALTMGGDNELAGQFVVFSSALSIFTLFGWVYFLSLYGML